jgi:hypothetical protein
MFNVKTKKEIFHFWSSKKLIFDSVYFYSFTYLTPVTIYFVPPNDPRMHCDLFWEKANYPFCPSSEHGNIGLFVKNKCLGLEATKYVHCYLPNKAEN